MSSHDQYKVIEIVDEFSLIIKYGTIHGAQKGDKLQIVAIGDVIKDPETGVELGTFDCIKETVSVEIAYEKFSLCKNIATKEINFLSPLSGALSSLNGYSEKNYNKLNVSPEDFTLRKLPSKTPVRVGDVSRLVCKK